MKFKHLILSGVVTLGFASGLASCGKVDGPTIGILKWVGANALNEAQRGFVDGLKEAHFEAGVNINIEYRDANGSSTDVSPLANSLLRNCDITLGIATPSAKALQAASEEMGLSKPLLFTAVTDAEDAGLVEQNEHPNGYITGTSDINPIEEQIQLIKDCLPGRSSKIKLGFAYTDGESNSLIQANRAKAEADRLGMDVEEEFGVCTGASDIPQVIGNLARKVDALYIPTDNNLAENMTAVYDNSNRVLISTGEVGQVIAGGHVSLSVDYYVLGKMTGHMAADILKGARPGDMPVQHIDASDCEYVYSSTWCRQSGITLPDEIIQKSRDVNA